MKTTRKERALSILLILQESALKVVISMFFASWATHQVN